MTLEEITKLSEILGNAGQFILGIFALSLSILALIFKRKDVFKTELAKAQLEELGRIRKILSEIFFDVGYVAGFKRQNEVMEWSLEDFKKNLPQKWEQLEKYKRNSLDLFYIFMTPDYYLFPSWVDKSEIKEHYKLMQTMAPFTVFATGEKSRQDIEKYQTATHELINKIDKLLVKNS